MEHGNTTGVRPKANISRTSSKKLSISKDIRVHYSDGGTGRIRASSIHPRSRDTDTAPSDNAVERQRKTKERYKALIRSSTYISQTVNKQNQEKRHNRRSQTFFDSNPTAEVQSDQHQIQLTPKKSNMKEETDRVHGTCIYRWRSPCSIEYDSPQSKPAKDNETTVTLQTTSISTDHSSSNSSIPEPGQTISDGSVIVPPSPRTREKIMIDTDVSNLTESSSSEEPDRIIRATRFFKENSTPQDQVLASISRLQEIERKRNVVRDKRFHLEQRLHNFRRVAKVSDTVSEDEFCKKEGSKMVVNWKYKASEHQSLLYTGRLNERGEPYDENALLRFGDDQIYKGGVLNGMRHGSGTNQWPDGQTYSGEWQNDSRNGRGTHIWKDGRTVTGNWKDGHLHGIIYFRWPNGAVFDGTACMGKKEGKGVTTRPDGTVYNGNYSNGKEDGFGTLIRPDGSKYRGDFKDGLKEGYGVMLRSTQTYDGEWANDRPHGQGRVVWSNGATFTGQFRKGTYSGMGVYVWPSGKKFLGRWENGVKHGHGVHTWPSGQVYDGAYSKGAREGYGRMTWPDGAMYCGGFQHNRRCGRGIQTDSDGAVVHCGLWKHDRPYGGPGEHEVLYVVRPQWKGAGKESNLPREEDISKIYHNLSDEKLILPSLPSLAPAIVTPREKELSSCDEEAFSPPKIKRKGIEDMRIISSSRNHSTHASTRQKVRQRILI